MKKKNIIWIVLLLIISVSSIFTSSCKKETKDTIEVAVLTTSPLKYISDTSACCGGIINSAGGSYISERGVCWGSEPSPTIATNCTSDEMEGGNFTSCITGLIPNKLYYARAYATNGAGTGYGNEISFTTLKKDIEFNPDITYGTVSDMDENVYKTIVIGTQTWMAENLRANHYRNGDLIRNPSDENECYVTKYGRQYLWYEIADSRNICPAGWHIPTFAEWTILENYLIANGYNFDGSTTGNKIAKSLASNSGWTPDKTEGSVGNADYPEKQNATGFSALPGGVDGISYVGEWGCWWTSSDLSEPNGWALFIDNNFVNARLSGLGKGYGLSVRCIMD